MRKERGKSKYSKALGMYHSYLFYKKQKKQEQLKGGSKKGITKIASRKEYSKIIKEFNYFIMYEKILNGEEFKMPFRLGVISVIQKRNKDFNQILEIAEYKRKLMTNIKVRTPITDEFSLFLKWDKSRCNIKNKSAFYYKVCKTFLAEAYRRKEEYKIEYNHDKWSNFVQSNNRQAL